jgi:hypothetical protein
VSRCPYARLKGKQNYLCPRVLESLEPEGAEEREVLVELTRWAHDDEHGDLDRFPCTDPEAFRRLRGRVATDPVACAGRHAAAAGSASGCARAAAPPPRGC